MHSVRIRRSAGWAALGWLCVTVAPIFLVLSCSSRQPPPVAPTELDLGWPDVEASWTPTQRLDADFGKGKQFWESPVQRTSRGRLPTVADASFVGIDAQCVLCHETHVNAFDHNVHRGQGCEKCHGAASRHLESRGLASASILSLKAPDKVTTAGKVLTSTERAEICLQCHEAPLDADPNSDVVAYSWSSSAHSHGAVACTGCHVAHYNVPPGTPAAVMASHNDSSAATALGRVRLSPPLAIPGMSPLDIIRLLPPLTTYPLSTTRLRTWPTPAVVPTADF